MIQLGRFSTKSNNAIERFVFADVLYMYTQSTKVPKVKNSNSKWDRKFGMIDECELSETCSFMHKFFL